MVNDKRKKIIQTLFSSSQAVSGEKLGSLTGISRVAVWKHIQALIREGYPVTSSGSGYVLSSIPDIPDAYTLDNDRIPVHHFTITDSTMERAKELFDPDSRYLLVTADTQTFGRGRKGRPWLSPEGGLYATVAFRPVLPVQYCSIYTLAAVLSLMEVIPKLSSLQPLFKWPNDIYIKGKKAGGVLTEISGETDRPSVCLLGIGMNFRDEECVKEYATLNSFCGEKASRSDFLNLFLQSLLPGIENIRADHIIENIKIAAEGLAGSKVFFGKSRIPLTVLDINTDGSLLASDGNTHYRIHSGDIYDFA